MNRINRNNYESYLIDLVEGNLDAQTADELMLFLDDNPDIREEFEAFDSVILEPEPVSFHGKASLKHNEIAPSGSINEDNYEACFIAWYENDLSVTEKKDLKRFIKKNPFLKKEFSLFGKLTLNSDDSVVFPDKEMLYQRRRVAPLFWISSAAAVIILLISVFSLLKYDVWVKPVQDDNRVAQTMQSDETIQPDVNTKNTVPVDNVNTIVDSDNNISKKVEEGLESSIITKPKLTTKPCEKEAREYAMVAPMPMGNPDIKLTSDEVYCRFRHKRPGSMVKPSAKKKSFVGNLLAGVFNAAKERIDPIADRGRNPEPLVAKMFDGGARVLNNYTGTEANVTKYYDNQGNLIAYHFSGGKINFSKQFKNSRKK